MNSDPNNPTPSTRHNPYGSPTTSYRPTGQITSTPAPLTPQPTPAPAPVTPQPTPTQVGGPAVAPPLPTATKPVSEASSKLASELEKFNAVAEGIRNGLCPASEFNQRCQQAFDLANDLFGHAPTWVCFYRELMAGSGLIHRLFSTDADFGAFLRTEQYHQIQLMLTALRSRDLPENDPNDPQRMITVRLPKSLHEAMCDEAGRLNISVNRLCISRMLQLLDPKMIPETNSKPRGRKPRSRQKQEA